MADTADTAAVVGHSTEVTGDAIVVDTRGADSFTHLRVKHAWNIPIAELPDRAFELPARHTEYFIVAAEAEVDAAVGWLTDSSRTVGAGLKGVVVWERVAPQVTSEAASGDGGGSGHCRGASEAGAGSGAGAGTLVTTRTTTTTSEGTVAVPVITTVPESVEFVGTALGSTETGVPRFPFSPAPLVDEWLPRLATDAVDGSVLDLGCGAGRDAVVLAHWFPSKPVVCIDNQKLALDRVAAFASRQCLSNVVPVFASISDAGSLAGAVAASCESLGSPRFSIVVLSRFLNRAIFRDIVDLLADGGFLLIHHFMMSAWRPKKPKDKLDPGELRSVFEGYGLEVLQDSVVTGGDGRELSMFVARKPEPEPAVVTDT